MPLGPFMQEPWLLLLTGPACLRHERPSFPQKKKKKDTRDLPSSFVPLTNHRQSLKKKNNKPTTRCARVPDPADDFSTPPHIPPPESGALILGTRCLESET
ncbi:hypothetical protein VPH35_100981 [Triticum aestivum]